MNLVDSWQSTAVKTKVALASVCLLVLMVLVELLAFNHHYVFDKVADKSFTYKSVALPFNEQLSANLLVVNHEQNELTLNDLNQRVANVALQTQSNYAKAIKISVFAKKPQGTFVSIGNTKINPANPEQNTALIHFNEANDQDTYETIKIKVSCPTPFVLDLTKLELNVAEPLNFSWVRVLLGFLILEIIYSILQFKFYQVVLDERKLTHRMASYAVVAAALGICTFFFWATYPKSTIPYYWNFPSDGSYAFNTNEQALLYKLPETIEETNAAGAYEQLLAAWLKGQNNINVYSDPKIEQLKNPYDMTEKSAAGVRFTFDRPYYQGKYYVYFGVAPLIMLYAPVYALTGMVPAPALAMYLLSFMAVLAMLWAYRALVRAFVPRANLLLYILVQLAALSASSLWLVHVGLSFYYLPYVAAMTWLSVYLACIYSLFKPADERLTNQSLSKAKIRCLLLLAGISVPMLVASRPLALVALLALSVPAIILLVKENYQFKSVQENSTAQAGINYLAAFKDSLFTMVPVVVGALLIMYYNYVRFESVSEFGQSYQFTSEDISAKGLVLGWPYLKNVLYYYFFSPLSYVKEFPFVWANTKLYEDHGHTFFSFDYISVFAIPIFWLLALGLRAAKSQLGSNTNIQLQEPRYDLPAKTSGWNDVLLARIVMFRITVILTLFAMLFIAYGSYYNAGVSSRYISETLTTGTYIVVVAVLLNITWSDKGAATEGNRDSSLEIQSSTEYSWVGQVVFLFTLFVVLKSLIIGLLLPFCYTYNLPLVLGTIFNDLNPTLMVDCYRIFTPWGH